jgi:hypothetical protein
MEHNRRKTGLRLNPTLTLLLTCIQHVPLITHIRVGSPSASICETPRACNAPQCVPNAVTIATAAHAKETGRTAKKRPSGGDRQKQSIENAIMTSRREYSCPYVYVLNVRKSSPISLSQRLTANLLKLLLYEENKTLCILAIHSVRWRTEKKKEYSCHTQTQNSTIISRTILPNAAAINFKD